MIVRRAKQDDLSEIMQVYHIAKAYMVRSGNPTQWSAGYPSAELILRDMEHEQCYVCESNAKIHGVFAFIVGVEPTYAVIEQGAWKTDAPYGTIHRIAADGTEKGVFKQCLDFCRSQIPNLRADTHHNNQTMQHLLEKNGFQKCGIITVADGTPRIAYQFMV